MQIDTQYGIIVLILAIIALGLVLYINIFEPLAFLDNSIVGNGLGNLCTSETDCRNFCHDNRGRCNSYCQENPSNELCNIFFGGR